MFVRQDCLDVALSPPLPLSLSPTPLAYSSTQCKNKADIFVAQ